MNALLKAKSAYTARKAPTRTLRDTEYEIVARITRRMIAASNPKDIEGFKELVHAVNDNRKLWSLFTVDLASTGNELPPSLKAKLLSLANFSRDHGSKVTRRKASAQPLIEINTAIMRGLRSGAP